MDYERILTKELKGKEIKIAKWMDLECGFAYCGTREIDIPQPTTQYKLGVCFHEIGHIMLNHQSSKYRYVEEYEAERYAIAKLKEYGIYNIRYIVGAKLHVISWIIKAMQKKHSINNVPKEIIRWCKINKKEWEGTTSITIPCNQKPRSIKKALIILL